MTAAAASSIDEKETIIPLSSEKTFRIRKYLLILLTIQWAACLIALITRIYLEITENNRDDIWDKIASSFPILALLLYYTFGFLFVYKYHRIGIVLFATIGILLLTITCLIVLYAFFVIMVLGVDYNVILGVEVFIIFALIFGTFVGIAILTLKLALNLAKSIKTNGYAIV